MAAAGSVDLTRVGIATDLNCTAESATNLTLIVGEKLNATNTQLFCGSALVGEEITSPIFLKEQSEGATAVTGNILDLSGLNFTDVTEELVFTNLALCVLPSTDVAVQDDGRTIVISDFGTAVDNQTLVFSLQAGELQAANRIVFDLSRNDTLVIVNLDGGQGQLTFTEQTFQLNGFPANQILFNVCNSTVNACPSLLTHARLTT